MALGHASSARQESLQRVAMTALAVAVVPVGHAVLRRLLGGGSRPAAPRATLQRPASQRDVRWRHLRRAALQAADEAAAAGSITAEEAALLQTVMQVREGLGEGRQFPVLPDETCGRLHPPAHHANAPTTPRWTLSSLGPDPGSAPLQQCRGGRLPPLPSLSPWAPPAARSTARAAPSACAPLLECWSGCGALRQTRAHRVRAGLLLLVRSHAPARPPARPPACSALPRVPACLPACSALLRTAAPARLPALYCLAFHCTTSHHTAPHRTTPHRRRRSNPEGTRCPIPCTPHPPLVTCSPAARLPVTLSVGKDSVMEAQARPQCCLPLQREPCQPLPPPRCHAALRCRAAPPAAGRLLPLSRSPPHLHRRHASTHALLPTRLSVIPSVCQRWCPPFLLLPQQVVAELNALVDSMEYEELYAVFGGAPARPLLAGRRCVGGAAPGRAALLPGRRRSSVARRPRALRTNQQPCTPPPPPLSQAPRKARGLKRVPSPRCPPRPSRPAASPACTAQNAPYV